MSTASDRIDESPGTSAVEARRSDFPILFQEVHGQPLTYLDSAASSQRPLAVIDAVDHYEKHDHANVHRGVHTLSHRATEAYEGAREKVRRFINATSTAEIVFTRGTTEAINLVANSWGGEHIGAGDEILITWLEHHANIVPWQMLCERTGATLKVAPIDDDGAIDMAGLESLITERTRLIAFSHTSNALGTINPAREIIALAKERGIVTLVDGAQAVPHGPVDVNDLGCDFFAFSGHKMYGPTGIGVLYGREELLERMPPWQGGGDMILTVSFEGSTWNELPYKFEAGTPNISGAVGLGAAVDYLESVGTAAVAAHEAGLLRYTTQELEKVDGLRIIGTAPRKVGVVSFMLANIHPHDLGTILDQLGVAIRTGHHCAMPVMERYGLPGTARASLGLYNNREDIDRLVASLGRARQVFGC
ncbi:MAG: cysteine desulfurase [Gammaproteobacteria bacterium]